MVKTAVVDEVLGASGLTLPDDAIDSAKEAVSALIERASSQENGASKVDRRLVDAAIEELDQKISEQMDAILHHESFQAIEKAWRQLDFLVSRTNFKENIKIHVLDVTKEELVSDFSDASEITDSSLYRMVYTDEYGQFGGEPVGAMVGAYDFGPGETDCELLKCIANVANMSHAPFMASASAAFLGLDSWGELYKLKDLESVFDSPKYQTWNGLRSAEDSRNVCLALPRFLLRTPYGPQNEIGEFAYEEKAENGDNFCWGNAAFALATRVVDSFAKYRWCPNIIGPKSGGAVTGLPSYVYDRDGKFFVAGPVEIPISDRREFEFSNLGFAPLTLRKGTDNASFFSANSIQRVKFFGSDPEAKQAELNYRLGTQFPYLFVVTRLAHYLKVLQRENLGGWVSRGEIEAELNRWIRGYVADQENVPAAMRSTRPLRNAKIAVDEIPSSAGWYAISMEVTPHFKFMGANFTLSLTGSIESGDEAA